MKQLAHLLGGALFSIVVSATTNAFATTDTFIPAQVFTPAYSRTLVIVPPTGHSVVNPSNCGTTTGYGLDDTGFGGGGQNERVSLAIAAILNAKTLTVDILGCTTDGYPLVTLIRLFQ
jgi:hypothetical protein